MTRFGVKSTPCEFAPYVAIANSLDHAKLGKLSKQEPQMSDLVAPNVKEPNKDRSYLWFAQEDTLAVNMRVSLPSKFNTSSIVRRRKEKLTFRNLICLLKRQYDPLGIISPWLNKLIVVFEKMKAVNCDDTLPVEWQNFWYNRMAEAFRTRCVKFLRVCKPKGCKGDYTLLISCEASQNVYRASAYICWQMKDGTHQTQLMLAKYDINAQLNLDPPKLELLALWVVV